MTALLYSRSLKTLYPSIITGHRSYNVGRAATVTAAIAKALRKSNGKAFDGPSKKDPKDPREIYKAKVGLPEYRVRGGRRLDRPGVNNEGWQALKKSVKLSKQLNQRGWGVEDGSSSSQRGSSSRGRRGRTVNLARRFGREGRDSRSIDPTIQREQEKIDEVGRRRERISAENYGYSIEPSSKSKIERSNSDASDQKERPLVIKRVIDKGVPLSIPYTTPASEFLYGTSVVGAALKSRREPRRRLYKLYIYTGENRKDSGHDAEFERLAKYQNIAVQHVGSDWQHLLNKLSGGRPHNGYILEASPLPRVPVTKLGAFISNEESGFSIGLDYQSKEEAVVNGTSDFVRVPRNFYGRKPLILFLDSILDPQNLGGIIRTASFLGVSCVAISTRNCAPFSPVVLKASAGASENMTLLSVNKPESFIQESRAAGWRIYAAVPPANEDTTLSSYQKNHRQGRSVQSLSTDQLSDPLAEAPSILMLGSEGEGLRKHLRNHADVELYIRGSATRHSVDSLNVNVATGVLCNAFIKKGKLEEELKEEREALAEEKKALAEEREAIERMRPKEIPLMGDLF